MFLYINKKQKFPPQLIHFQPGESLKNNDFLGPSLNLQKWNFLEWGPGILILKYSWDFHGGAVVKNPPANAGDAGSSPGPGRSRMPWSNEARAPQLLILRSRACEPQRLSPHATTTEGRMPRARAPQQEKPLQ